MSQTKEVRAFPVSIELRKDDQAEQRFVDGVGVIYDKEVELWDGYYEKIDRNAFKDCLKGNPEIKSFFNHDPNYVLSTTASDPALVISDMGDGLMFSSPIPDTSYGRDLIENLKRGNVKGASFTFTVNRDSVTVDKDGNYHRSIDDATIYELGPVTNPAYTQTSVGLRSKDSLMEEARQRVSNDDVEAEHEYRRNVIALLEIENN